MDRAVCVIQPAEDVRSDGTAFLFAVAAGVALLMAALTEPVAAERIVRPTAELARIPVQGISLDMSSREAFDTLLAAGFQAGNLRDYDAWTGDGVEFVRGEYGSPSGYWSLFFQRRGDRIVSISETYNAPGNPIDAQAAISDLRRRLNIPADNPRCTTSGAHAGYCELQDAEEADQITTLFKLQIMTVMRIVTTSRPKELGM